MAEVTPSVRQKEGVIKISRKKQRGPNGERYYSAFNTLSGKYHFGICELSPWKAQKALKKRIGKDSYKWRWEIREIGFNHPYVQHAYRVKKLTPPASNESVKKYPYRRIIPDATKN